MKSGINQHSIEEPGPSNIFVIVLCFYSCFCCFCLFSLFYVRFVYE